MTSRMLELAERRARLVAKIEMQRATLAQCVEPLRAPLAVADKGWAAVCYLKRHPVYVAGAAALLIAWRPRGFLKLLKRGWFAWKILSRVRGALH